MEVLLSADSLTSFAFVVAGLVIILGERADPTRRTVYGGLVVATGVGSVIQHGPDPLWGDPAHDLPMVALILYLAVDAAADVTDRRLGAGWWIVPTVVLLPLIVLSPLAGDAAQGGMAAVAVALWLRRYWIRPAHRPTIVVAITILAVGAVVGTLSRQGLPLEQVAPALPGHAIWHVLAAISLWYLAPVVGSRTRPSSEEVTARRSRGRAD